MLSDMHYYCNPLGQSIELHLQQNQWRLSLGGARIPALVIAIRSLLFPDTPNSMIKHDKHDEARSKLRRIRDVDNIDEEFNEFIAASKTCRWIGLRHNMETSSNAGLVLMDRSDSEKREIVWIDLNTLESSVKLNELDDMTFATVFGSYNDLIIVTKLQLLWNPLTRKYKDLPFSRIVFPTRYSYCKSFIHGFGYDSINDEYMVNHHVDTLPLIVAFDLVAENYYDIPLPDYENEPCRISLEPFAGLLCLVCSYAADGVEFDE
ncbi:Sugar transport protein 1 [Morus notabilis]|uniref:Sugar transport protein 1 n=1 Tax=Morus notabilis TaxID=981085 RepID=W9R4N7_9ROSA|nr:Sugar transport protein 1 [Morus notabilis]